MRTRLQKVVSLLLIVVVFVPYLSMRAERTNIKINSNKSENPEVTVIKSDESEIILELKVNSYSLTTVETEIGKASILAGPGAVPVLRKGAPGLVKITASVIIPDFDNMHIEIVDVHYVDIENIDLAPSKGNLYRNIDPQDIPYVYGDEYSENKFYPSSIADLSRPYIVRDFRGQTVNFHSYRYNPVSKTLRVYTDITVKVTPTGEKGVNIKNRYNNISAISKEFNQIYNRHFINYENVATKYNSVGEEGNLLIIAHSDYLSLMQPLVDWKIQKGIDCELVEYSEIGSSANDIKTYIETYYNDNGLMFVLFVGDGEDIPSLYQSGDSDVAYGYIEGDDSYPEIFIGRFSGESEDDINTQVNRTVDYEKYPQEDAAWYSKNTLIGSDEGGSGQGDDDEADWEHMQNIRTDLMAFTYTAGDELYDGSHGGEDASGNPTPTDLANALNEGSSLLAYVGHGSDYSFVTTGFSNTHANELENDNMLPFIFDVACVNGNFHNQTCLAEAFMRATNGDNPTGAIAINASTINQSWAPPMSGQDEMIDILVESYDDNIKRTFGGITMNGCMQMNDDYGSGGDEMTDTWTIFGDPSLVVRTAAPQVMSVTHNPVIFIGLTEMQVQCDAEGAYAALTFNGELVGTGVVEGGVASVSFESFTNVGTATLTITGFNAMPYIVELDVIPNDGAFVVLDGYEVYDEDNNEAEYEEQVRFNFSFKNVGNENAGGVTAVISSDDEYVVILDTLADLGTVNSEEIQNYQDLFLVEIANNVTDQYMIKFKLELTDELDSVWTSYFNIPVNAPKLSVDNIVLNDNNGGNGNGRFDAGEVVDMDVFLQNFGNADSKEATLIVTTRSNYITILNEEIDLGIIAQRGIVDTTIVVTIDPLTPIGTSIGLTFTLIADQYMATETITRSVGLMLEDFESGDFSLYDWNLEYDSTWFISDESYEGGFGIKSDTIIDEEEASFSLEINVNADDTVSFYKKVSSESGYDYLRFYIDGSLQEQWSGEEDWSRVAFPVSAGLKTLKWTYYKDYSVSNGADCAWIDYIILPGFAQDSAGGNDTLQFISYADTIARLNDLYIYNIEATSSNNESVLEFSCHTAPEWLSIEDKGDGTAILSGTPDNVDLLGYHEVILCVTNGESSAFQMLSLLVMPAITVNEFSIVSNSFAVYPNPAINSATIEFNLEEKSQVALSVVNVLGKQVYIKPETEMTNGIHRLNMNLEAVPGGIYFVNLIIGNQKYTQRIIKE
ncbi:C25 family cysteine peptidase [Bacteroidota bacterium]